LNTILGHAGEKVLLMGNEAIARGALEGGVHVVTGYPGTPSSEVIMALSRISEKVGVKVEWFANEKVAFEVALAASNAGLRSMVTMKAPGLNVASDSIFSAAYCGVNGGMIILVADDPGPHTTQTEQDSRFYSILTGLPMLDPSSPQEAKDAVVWGLEISERLKLPVFLRTTTRVNHTTADIVLGDVKRLERKPFFPRDLPRYVRASMKWNYERHRWLDERMKTAEKLSDNCPLNSLLLKGDFGIITSGVSYLYVVEVLKRLNVEDCSILKIGICNPLPKKLINSFLSHCKHILFVEELTPFLEFSIRAFSTLNENSPKFYGKLNGYLPFEGELNPSIVKDAVSRFLFSKPPHRESNDLEKIKVPSRPPPMCPGCPHRSAYYALLTAIRRLGYKREDVPIFGDIGCYALSLQKPLEAIWTEHCMGASISMALGLKFAGYDKPVVATIGDSTFFHAGLPALADAVHLKENMVVVILDNRITAMTGHQPHPGVEFKADGSKAVEVDIVDVVKGLGVEKVKVVDPYDIMSCIKVFEEALTNRNGVFVIIARRECALLARRMGIKLHSVHINYDKCVKCRSCISTFGCPAILWNDEKGPVIIPSLCNGCGSCSYICPFNAIEVEKND